MIAAIYARTSAAIRTVMRHLILGLGGLGLLVTATPATGEAAWVLWVSPYHYDPDWVQALKQVPEWRLHSAYTFRATCLFMGVYLPTTQAGVVPKTNLMRIQRTWCLPPGVRPE